MERIGYGEGCEMLRKVGCTIPEIEQLSELRKNYTDQGNYRRIVAYSPPRREGWFERMLRKALCAYLPSTTSEDMFWLNNHFLW
ncbi:MAG: hypothetical protein NVS4B11_05640 [Ktedonobacteraceae bacterium]